MLLPEPDQFGCSLRARPGLRLEETDAGAEVAHEDGPVVLPQLVHLPKPEHVRYQVIERAAIADVQGDMVESLEAEG